MKYKVCKFLIIYYTRISIEMKCHTLPILQSKYFYVASVRFDGSVPEAFLLKEVVARMQPSTLHVMAFPPYQTYWTCILAFPASRPGIRGQRMSSHHLSTYRRLGFSRSSERRTEV